jgi:hypothetical protein
MRTLLGRTTGWVARGDVFEIEALVNTVQALASRDNWLGKPFVNEWNSVLRDFEATAESLNAAYTPIMPVPYLNGSPLAGRRIHCGDWDTGPNWQSPFAALRSILLFVVTNLTILRADADVSYLEPITQKWLNDDRTTVASLNYDNALETSARGMGVEVDDGIGSYQRTRRVSFSSGGMPLLKLHGSGSWAEQRIAGEATGGEDFLYAPWANLDANHYNGKWIQPAIIMGGENKLQARGPFLELYIEFKGDSETPTDW